MRHRLRFGHLHRAAIIAALLAGLGVHAFANNSQQTAKYYENATRLIAQGDHRGAIIELKNALRADPQDIPARLLLGQTYLKLNRGQAAAQELLHARRDGAGDRFILVPLGKAYLSQGLFEKVLDEIHPTGQDEDTATEIAMIRGDAEVMLRRYDDAERSYRQAHAARPDDPRPHTGLANILLARGKLAEASQHAALALKANPDSPQAWYVRARIERRRGNVEAALSAYDRVIELYPHALEARLDRAKMQIDLDRYDEAERDVLAARSIKPRSARAAYVHAILLSKQGRKKDADEALIEAEQILRELPAEVIRSHPPTMLLFGLISYFRGNYNAAFGHLSALLERVPDQADARRLLGSISLERGQPSQAVAFLRPLAERRKNDLSFLMLYSDALIRARRFTEASDVLDRATEISPPDSNTTSRLLKLRLAAGDDDEAIGLLQAEIARKPPTAATALTLATIQMRKKNYTAALSTIDTVLEKHPDNPMAHNLAGGVFLAMKDNDEARRRFEAALKVKPDYLPALENLGRLDVAQGNMAAARQTFLRILELDPENGNAMSHLADLERRAGDMDSAIRWLEKARRESRDSETAALKLIDVYRIMGKKDATARLAEDLHRQDPANPAFIAAFGRARLTAGQVDAAAALFGKLVDRATELKSADWLYKAALGLTRAHRPDEARRALEAALKTDNRHALSHVALFNLDLAAGNADAAMARADRVAALFPDAPTAEQLRGRVHMWAHRYADAAQSFGAAFEKAPNSATAALVFDARHRAGLNVLDFAAQWARKNPNDRMAQRLLAGAYFINGRVDEAIALYERMVEKEPDNIEYLNNVANLYQRKGDPRAVAMAKRAYDINPSHGGLTDTYGWILVQNDRLEQGLRLLRSARTRMPDVPEIRYHLAVALNMAGQPDEARRELRAALDSGQTFAGIDDARALLRKLTGTR